MKQYLVVLVILAGCSVYFEPQFNISNETKVFQVVDGDTFMLSSGEYVRIASVDAPERGEEGYHEATDFLRNLTEGKVVELVADGADRDRYGRLLRHVYINGTNVAALLLNTSHAVNYSDR